MDLLRRLFGGKQSQMKKALTRLGSKDPEERQDAARLLGQLGGEEAIEALLGALKHEDPGTQACAASALGEIGGQRAIQALRQVVANQSAGGWDMAMLTLAKHRERTVLAPAIRVLSDRHNEWYVGMIAARALGDLGDAEAIGPLKDAASDSNDFVRLEAVDSLQRISK